MYVALQRAQIATWLYSTNVLYSSNDPFIGASYSRPIFL